MDGKSIKPPKREGTAGRRPALEVKVSITNTDVFEALFELFKGFLGDGRVPKEVRQEFIDKLREVTQGQFLVE